MGHESLQSTMIYQDVTEKQKLEAIESLGNTITKQMEKKWKSPRVRHLAEAFGINVEWNYNPNFKKPSICNTETWLLHIDFRFDLIIYIIYVHAMTNLIFTICILRASLAAHYTTVLKHVVLIFFLT